MAELIGYKVEWISPEGKLELRYFTVPELVMAMDLYDDLWDQHRKAMREEKEGPEQIYMKVVLLDETPRSTQAGGKEQAELPKKRFNTQAQ